MYLFLSLLCCVLVSSEYISFDGGETILNAKIDVHKNGDEFIVINPYLDVQWIDYFSSWREYHYALYGPSKSETINWDEWFQIDSEKYLVSPDCNKCNLHDSLNGIHKTKTAYYMSPVNSGCYNLPIARVACDWNYETYQCNACTGVKEKKAYLTSYPLYNGLNDANGDNVMHWKTYYNKGKYNGEVLLIGSCGFMPNNAFSEHDEDTDGFEYCISSSIWTTQQTEETNLIPRSKPSIGTDGRYCVCAKIDDSSVDVTHHTKEEYEAIRGGLTNDVGIYGNVDDGSVDESDDVIIDDYDLYELYQSDFEDGTFIISKSGYYKIMEDIEFNFGAPKNWNSGNLESYNGETDWFPTDSSKYVGAGSLSGSFFIGYWAGIVIQSKDVILDLNGYEIAQSLAFYYQQAFFTNIALSSQYFIPNQGPLPFGTSILHSERIVIKNGNIGLSSHHGIQGHYTKDLTLQNLNIYNFKTHGIQLSGFQDVKMQNIDIGNNFYEDRLTPFYTHMRALLPLHREMATDDVINDVCIEFKGRDGYENEGCHTISRILSDIIILLDYSFKHVMFDYDPESEQADITDDHMRLWQKNKRFFVNDHFYPQTAVVYGIFLNYAGANVLGWYFGNDDAKSTGLNIDNVAIHDLYHNTFEEIALDHGAAKRVDRNGREVAPLNTPLDALQIFGDEQIEYISKCINFYSELDPDDTDCDDFHLKYVGSRITDILLMQYYLILNYQNNANYILSGLLKLDDLTDFAVNAIQFGSMAPKLFGTHDPMVHPGKGVIGIKINGVDFAVIKDLKIHNIESETKLGSKLIGPYTQTVTQQQPYMVGYSMNMAQALAITMCKHMEIENVDINTVKSATGLTRGIALWYETDVTFTDTVTIKNLYAGHRIEEDENFDDEILYNLDLLPNRTPEVCGISFYDDDDKTGKITYDDDVIFDMQSFYGYTGCNRENGVLSYVGDVKQDGLLSYKYNEKKNIYHHYSPSLLLLIIITVAILLFIKYCWYNSSNNKEKYTLLSQTDDYESYQSIN